MKFLVPGSMLAKPNWNGPDNKVLLSEHQKNDGALLCPPTPRFSQKKKKFCTVLLRLVMVAFCALLDNFDWYLGAESHVKFVIVNGLHTVLAISSPDSEQNCQK